jgi:hypothetical protein
MTFTLHSYFIRITLGQPTQDNHDHMVNKLDMETTANRSYSQQKYKSPHHKKQEKVTDLKHIRCFKCSDMGHCAFMCSAQIESVMSHPVLRPKLNAFLYVCQDQVTNSEINSITNVYYIISYYKNLLQV